MVLLRGHLNHRFHPFHAYPAIIVPSFVSGVVLPGLSSMRRLETEFLDHELGCGRFRPRAASREDDQLKIGKYFHEATDRMIAQLFGSEVVRQSERRRGNLIESECSEKVAAVPTMISDL